MNLATGIQTLKAMGFFDFFLPFLLFFAIIYATLDKTQVFGADKKDINAIVALVIALIASTTSWVIKGVTGFLPWVGFIALVVVAFLMLAAMVYGGNVDQLISSPAVKYGGLIFVVIALGLGLYYGLGFDKAVGSGISLSDDDIAMIIMLIVGIGAFFLIVKGGSSSSQSGGS